jgi:hypothetical protein
MDKMPTEYLLNLKKSKIFYSSPTYSNLLAAVESNTPLLVTPFSKADPYSNCEIV